MPTVNNVIVFGDSLSDIGRKWVTKSGRMARMLNEMYVSPTGRFSDCRNWTDFMFEEATGVSMLTSSAETSITLSERHLSLTRNSRMTGSGYTPFFYVNYAEGGACGDTPASKGPFLGTFKDQVDLFLSECPSGRLSGNTLYIVWFGANDLYTAKRAPTEMNQVAQQIAVTQRARLHRAARGNCQFIFVDMARPLTSVRYTLQLQKAENELRRLFPGTSLTVMGNQGGMWRANDALQAEEMFGLRTSTSSVRKQAIEKVEALKKLIVELKGFEQGVLLFNVTLANLARHNGDRVAEISACITEDTVRQLIERRLVLAGADSNRATHQSASLASASTTIPHISTIDEAHPSERVYRLIWKEIYKEIKASGWTFGKLTDVREDTLLSQLGGPSSSATASYSNVLGELKSKFV